MNAVYSAIAIQAGFLVWGITRLIPSPFGRQPLTEQRPDIPDRWTQDEWELAA